MIQISVVVGAAIFVSVALLMALWLGPKDPSWSYLIYPTLWGSLVGFLFYAAINWPKVKTDMQRHRTEEAELKHKADHLNDAPPTSGPVVEQPSNRAKYANDYTNYYKGLLRYARDAGGLTFRQIQPYFGANRAAALITWQKMLRPLGRQGILEPIEEGKPTAFRVGWDMDKAIAWFEAGHTLRDELVPPYPPPDAFESLKQVTEEREETRE